MSAVPNFALNLRLHSSATGPGRGLADQQNVVNISESLVDSEYRGNVLAKFMDNEPGVSESSQIMKIIACVTEKDVPIMIAVPTVTICRNVLSIPLHST